MSKVNVTLKESAIQYGLILGGILAILIVMMYALNQDLFLEWWIGIVVIPLIIIGTGIVSTAKSKDLLGGIMTFKEAFTAYFITIALGLLISTAVGILIFSIIDPELAKYIQEQSIEISRGIMERFDTPPEMIEEELDKLRGVDNYSFTSQLKSYFGSLVFFSVIGLLVGLIFKKADPKKEKDAQIKAQALADAKEKLTKATETENNEIIGANPNDIPSTGLNIICFLIPVVGLIIYLIEKDKAPKKANAAGKAAIWGVGISFLLGVISIIISIAMLA